WHSTSEIEWSQRSQGAAGAPRASRCAPGATASSSACCAANRIRATRSGGTRASRRCTRPPTAACTRTPTTTRRTRAP
ncbi:MAG: hypothetical protein AVDCRST_MAG67-4241, partial [uncultured Solirubrobacteraceae bacterium]